MPYVPTTALLVINSLTMGFVPAAPTITRAGHARHEQIQKGGRRESAGP